MKLPRKLLFSTDLVRMAVADCRRSLEEQRRKHRHLVTVIFRGGSMRL